ncbi:metal-dependent transcriptional regulator [Natrinema sp. DC36]|uniref:metal-dependent transcriptional regulator n=1 Tax=Natrinema sp. DC36 TaxID=2878680 RepID=UPI001CF03037|nr:metal-dependent transcriptional regulator [Natrinema sp. DC36]
MATEITSTASGLVGATVGRRTGQYLLEIDWLSEDTDRVAPGEIATRLDVSGASVTEMGSKLEDAGLVTVKKYTGVKLTEKGSEVARELTWRLCVVENFFGEELSADLDDDQSYEIGYTLPPEAIKRLRDLVDHPCIDRCPQTRQDYDGCRIA